MRMESLPSLIVDDARRSAGHAHWQNIAKTKAANDQMKGRVIGKLATKIVASIRRQIDQSTKIDRHLIVSSSSFREWQCHRSSIQRRSTCDSRRSSKE